jgi:hypothetical protein
MFPKVANPWLGEIEPKPKPMFPLEKDEVDLFLKTQFLPDLGGDDVPENPISRDQNIPEPVGRFLEKTQLDSFGEGVSDFSWNEPVTVAVAPRDMPHFTKSVRAYKLAGIVRQETKENLVKTEDGQTWRERWRYSYNAAGEEVPGSPEWLGDFAVQ